MSRAGSGAAAAYPSDLPALPDLHATWPGRDLADADHHLRRSLEPVLEATRSRSAGPDPDAVETVLRQALRLGADDDLPRLAMAYRRGVTTRNDLYRSPAFGAAMTGLFADALRRR